MSFKQKLMNLNTDYDGAMERFVGKEELYHNFLVKFLDDTNFSNLKESLNQGDLASAFQYAHTLKGLVGNLGLNLLFDTTHSLVELLRNHQVNGTQELMDTLERNYQTICNLIRNSIV